MAKVIRQFEDKETKVMYIVGSEYAGSKDRVKELTDKGYLEAEQPKKKKNEV